MTQKSSRALILLALNLFIGLKNVNAANNTKDYSIVPGKRFYMDGINCHSTSLQSAGLLSYPTYVDAEEFEFVIRSQCEPVQNPEAGVVGWIGGKGLGSHSFYFLNPSTIIQKPGLKGGIVSQSRDATYEIRRTKVHPSVPLFRCSLRSSKCQDARLQHLNQEVRTIGIYFAELALNYQNPRALPAVQQRLNKTYQDIRKLYERNAKIAESCIWDRSRIFHRARSLKILSKNTSSLSITLQQIPPGPKM